MSRLKLALPWPARELWPNRSGRQGMPWQVKRRLAKEARALARLNALVEGWNSLAAGANDPWPVGDIPVTLTFCPPNRIRRDLDGMYSACKPYQDGLAEALGLDDSRFNPVTLRRGAVVKGGQVIVEIGE